MPNDSADQVEEVTIRLMDSSLDDPESDFDVCAEHGRAPFKYFCTTHWCLCCPNCVKPGGPHSACKFIVSDLIRIPLFKEDLKKRSEKLAQDIDGIHDITGYITEVSQDVLNESVARAREVIIHEFNLIREALEEKENEIMRRLESIIEQRDKEVFEVTESSPAMAQKGIDFYNTWDDHELNENIAVACDVKHECDKFYSTVTKKIDTLCNVYTIKSKVFAEPIVNEIRKINPVDITKEPFKIDPSVKEKTEKRASLGWDPAFFDCKYQVIQRKNNKSSFEEVYEGEEPKCDFAIRDGQKYATLFTRFKVQGFTSSWSGPYTVKIGTANRCWADCPDNVTENMKYELRNDSFIAEKRSSGWSTVIGEVPISGTKTWEIKILNSKNDNGDKIYVGVAPVNIDQNVDNNYCKCGWYIDCYSCKLWSGSPHNYRGDGHGAALRNGRYVNTNSRVRVTMNTENGSLTFSLAGANVSTAYEGIPLDNPLVPCVVFFYGGDSIEYVI